MTRDEAVAEITRRLVEVCQPVRIYLFGSAARGDDGPDSDLDFLVVVSDDAPDEIFRGDKLMSARRGIAYAADVVPWRQSDFQGRAAYVVASLPATVMRREDYSMTPDEFLLDETRKWVRQSSQDLHAAEKCAPELPAPALFHCQQAAEELLKAFLTWTRSPSGRHTN